MIEGGTRLPFRLHAQTGEVKGMSAERDESEPHSAAVASTVGDLAQLLRWLRRRHARQQRDAPLTYREIAALTGWSRGIIGSYLTGKVLPPTNRFDTLVQILGATAAEQGALATARDRVEERERAGVAAARGGVARVIPRQLPGDVVGFTGRARELADLDDLLDLGANAPAAVISAVSGAAGVGKTALAVHWAHQVADRFPDGQLYVNLRGFWPDGQAMETGEVIRVLLDALGVAARRIPADLDSQIGLYRSLLTRRRVLVLLDNATDVDQVRPLLPSAPGCMALVTSRIQLTGLVASDGAHPITLDLLTLAEARQLLTTRLGHARGDAEPEAVEAIVTSCARLPLALVVVAARGAVHPGFPLAELAHELRGSRGLQMFHCGDTATDVRAAFSWSYHRLGPDAARLFRLLGLHRGPDISEPAAASLAGISRALARQLLIELARASLLAEHSPGRFTFHDLLRAYATELAHAVENTTERTNATQRVIDHYLQTGYTAAMLLDPHRKPPPLAACRAGVAPERIPDQAHALTWFGAEHHVLLAAIDHAIAIGQDSQAWQIAWTLVDFLDQRGHWHDWATAHTSALAAAQRTADAAGQAITSHQLARAHIRLGHYGQAHLYMRLALDLYTRLGDQAGQSSVHDDYSDLRDEVPITRMRWIT